MGHKLRRGHAFIAWSRLELEAEVGRLQALYEARGQRVEELEAEVKRLQHIINVLRNSIEMTNQAAMTVEDHVRVRNGRVEVWVLGDWLDLEQEQAKDVQAEGSK